MYKKGGDVTRSDTHLSYLQSSSLRWNYPVQVRRVKLFAISAKFKIQHPERLISTYT